MSFASGLYHARKKSGLSQENVAEKLGVSRQTISKWETGETLPDIRQSKRLAVLYHITLDELVEYDFDEQQAREMIDSVSEEAQAKIDWNRVWSKKYPVLATYHKTVRIEDYAPPAAGDAHPAAGGIRLQHHRRTSGLEGHSGPGLEGPDVTPIPQKKKGQPMDYTREELAEAKRQIDSTLHKLRQTVKTLEEKENPARYKSQLTLAKRRIEAFTLANELIHRELEALPTE